MLLEHAETLGYRIGLLHQQIEGMTVSEISRMWDGFAWRCGDEMRAMATMTAWLRSLLDDKTSAITIRESFGWTEKE